MRSVNSDNSMFGHPSYSIKSGSPSLGAAGVRDELNLTRPGRFLHARGRQRVQFHGGDYTRKLNESLRINLKS
jgi:hypothetical protein